MENITNTEAFIKTHLMAPPKVAKDQLVEDLMNTKPLSNSHLMAPPKESNGHKVEDLMNTEDLIKSYLMTRKEAKSFLRYGRAWPPSGHFENRWEEEREEDREAGEDERWRWWG